MPFLVSAYGQIQFELAKGGTNYHNYLLIAKKEVNFRAILLFTSQHFIVVFMSFIETFQALVLLFLTIAPFTESI